MGKKKHYYRSSSSSSSSSSDGGCYRNPQKMRKKLVKIQRKMIKKRKCVCGFCPAGVLACPDNFMRRYQGGNYAPGNPMAYGGGHGSHANPGYGIGSAHLIPGGGPSGGMMPGYPSGMPYQSGIAPGQPGMMPYQPGMMTPQPGIMPPQPGIMPNQPGMMPGGSMMPNQMPGQPHMGPGSYPRAPGYPPYYP